MNVVLDKTRVNEGCRVSVAQTIKDVEALRGTWQEYAWHPRMDLEVYLAAQRLHSAVSLPYVLTMSRNGELVGMLAGRIEETEFEIRLGYWSVWKTKLRAITFPYAGVLGDLSLSNAQAACLHLAGALRRREADAIFFEWLPVKSEISQAVQSSSKVWWRNAFSRANPHWKMRLPESADELWNRSRNRRNW